MMLGMGLGLGLMQNVAATGGGHVTGASPAAGAGFQDNYYTLTAP
jgi:C4-dicarboxylate-specific signal transduction histidine kinase